MRSVQTVVAAALFIFIAIGLTGCAPDIYREQRFVFGTLVEIQIAGVETAAARDAAANVFADFRYLHTALHPWRAGSLGRVNALLATTEWSSVSLSNLPLIKESKRLYTLSDGLFNPAMGKLVAFWGFHSDELPTQPPSDSQIDALLAQRPTMDDVTLDGIRLRSSNPAVKLDFGGIAKGHAVDIGISRLRAAGIDNAIINAGGDLRVIGDKDGVPWRVGVRDPRGQGVLAWLDVNGEESVFTSGDYERSFEYEGRRYHHILDPRTGRPARGAVSVTVIHGRATEADAAATALIVAGPTRWHDIARALGIRYVMLVDANGTVHMNPKMAERIRFVDRNAREVMISAPL